MISEELIKRAASGELDAMEELAEIYFRGNKEDTDDNKAFYWLNQIVKSDPDNTKALVDLGICYRWEYGTDADYEKAYECFSKAWEKGDYSAEFRLAEMFQNGLFVKHDIKKAVAYYEDAAKNNNVLAQTALGNLYMFGEDVPADYSKAYKWLSIAADAGNIQAMDNMGYMYTNGLGVEENHYTANSYYIKAAEQGSSCAQHNLGMNYLEGLGVEKNIDEAVKYLSLSAEQDDVDSIMVLAELYMDGQEVEYDFDKSVRYYKKAADLGCDDACLILSEIYSKPPNSDEEASCHYLEIAAERGNEEANIVLGNLCKDYYNDIDKAFDCYKKAYDLYQNPFAEYWLGDFYVEGKAVEQNINHGLYLIRSSAEKGLVIAQRRMGLIYDFGYYNVAKDLSQAALWFSKASKSGDIISILRLAELYVDGTGVEKNYLKAKNLYEQAIAINDPEWLEFVYYRLGQLLSVNLDNPERGFDYLLKSAELGYSDSQFIVGYKYYKGITVNQNTEQAIFWLKKSAENKNENAISLLKTIEDEKNKKKRKWFPW